MGDDHINEIISTSNKTSNSNMIYFHFPIRPTAVRPPKRVQFPTRIPTIREVSKGISIPPPGSTPISSTTNICATPVDVFTAKSQYTAATTKLIHSSTSLEVEFDDDVSSLASPSVSTAATATTTVTNFPTSSIYEEDVHSSSQEQIYHRPRANLQKKRGNSVPATMRIIQTECITEPEDVESVTNDCKNNNSRQTSASCSAPSKRSPSLPGKSILRNPMVLIKDNNSNIAAQSTAASKSSLLSTVAPSTDQVDNNGNVNLSDANNDAAAIVSNDEWENVGISCTPLAVTSSVKTMKASRQHNITPRSRTTLSSSSGSSYSDWRREFSKRKKSADSFSKVIILPTEMTGSRGGRNVPLPHLTSVCAELRQKEVIFDRASAIHGLKGRIMRGERVSYDEIKAIRSMTLPAHKRHMGFRLPWSKDLYCEKGLVHIPTPNKPTPKTNTFGTVDDLRVPVNNEMTMELYGRRHYVVNLAGFEDQHISLYLEGKNRLVLRAERHDGLDESDYMPMTVTETILLPPDLPADNLRIVRKPSGTTIIEESWRF